MTVNMQKYRKKGTSKQLKKEYVHNYSFLSKKRSVIKCKSDAKDSKNKKIRYRKGTFPPGSMANSTCAEETASEHWSIIIQVVNKQAKGSNMGKVNLRGPQFTKGDKNAQSEAPVSLSFPIFTNTWLKNSSDTRD